MRLHDPQRVCDRRRDTACDNSSEDRLADGELSSSGLTGGVAAERVREV